MTNPSMDGSLWVERVVDNHSVIVRVSGELDLRTAPQLDEQLAHAEAVVVPPAPVVLDLTGVEFLGSAGLSVLLEHHERCQELGTTLRIVPGGRAVTRPLTMTGLDKVLVVTIPAARPPVEADAATALD